MTIIRPTNGELGTAVRLLRRKHRMTIEDLAQAADFHSTYLSGVERGIRNPSWGKLVDLAYALETPLSSLVRDAETQAQLTKRMQEVHNELGLNDSRKG